MDMLRSISQQFGNPWSQPWKPHIHHSSSNVHLKCFDKPQGFSKEDMIQPFSL